MHLSTQLSTCFNRSPHFWPLRSHSRHNTILHPVAALCQKCTAPETKVSRAVHFLSALLDGASGIGVEGFDPPGGPPDTRSRPGSQSWPRCPRTETGRAGRACGRWPGRPAPDRPGCGCWPPPPPPRPPCHSPSGGRPPWCGAPGYRSPRRQRRRPGQGNPASPPSGRRCGPG